MSSQISTSINSPFEFLDYVTCNGAIYFPSINLGSRINYKVKFGYVNQTSTSKPYHAFSITDTNITSWIRSYCYQSYDRVYNENGYQLSNNLSIRTAVHTCMTKYVNGSYKLFVDDVDYGAMTNGRVPPSGTLQLTVGGSMYDSSSITNWQNTTLEGRLYELILYDGNDLTTSNTTYHFKPCKYGGVVGMYELVHNTFYPPTVGTFLEP